MTLHDARRVLPVSLAVAVALAAILAAWPGPDAPAAPETRHDAPQADSDPDLGKHQAPDDEAHHGGQGAPAKDRDRVDDPAGDEGGTGPKGEGDQDPGDDTDDGQDPEDDPAPVIEIFDVPGGDVVPSQTPGVAPSVAIG